MSRVSDNYESVIRGVSQQVPHDRLPGQHWDQDNLNSDPVRGLSRRHGSLQKAVKALSVAISQADIDDASGRLEQTVFVDGNEYAFMFRQGPVTASQLDPVIITHKDGHRFVDVISANAETTTILGEGVSTITAAGRFVLLGSSVRPVTHTTSNNMDPTKHLHVVWFRGGANSRKFTVTITTAAGVDKTYSYTTMPSFYEGRLDTSDIPVDANYGKNVNDRVNAYNTAVNQHISALAKDIAPANLATKLAALIAVDHPGVIAEGSYILLDIADVVVTAEDGGNGDFVRACSLDITAAELTTPRHYPGKVIKVVPKTAGSLPYYLKAESVSGSTAFGEVIWRETAGLNVTLGWVFCIGLFKADGKFYVANSTTALATLTGEEVPIIEAASSGDTDSNPIPEFFDRLITHMRMFQDRLMIVAGSTVFLSKSGDYFNFFRKSVLTVLDDDPIEVFAQGTEDDVITGGVQHDRNVILCGKRYQYIVPGRENMTPRNPYVGVQATYEGANLVQHAVAGSLLFFCQRRENRLTLQRMQPGAVADRLDALDVSNQLDGYLTGTPRQIVAMTAPGVVYVRTKELRNGFYVYCYLDSEDNSERLFDSWSRWVFDDSLGALAGITSDDSGLLAVTVRTLSTGPALVLDRFVRETGPSEMPYLDSMTPIDVANHAGDQACCAFDEESGQFLLGLPLARKAELVAQFPDELDHLHAGTLYDSFVTVTSPYLRDREGKIILDARVTVSKLTVALSNSASMKVELTFDMGKTWKPSKSWTYRPAGAWILNTQGIAEEATVTAPVMKENKTYRARISSRSWLPMTVASLEWAGQAFSSRS